jgi:Ca-activated chloride channel family protein
MTFEWPIALVGLAAVPLAVAAYVWHTRRRARVAERFGSLPLFPNLVQGRPGLRRHVPAAILVLALTAMLMGVARPHATMSVQKEEATVVLAFDVSRSMGAPDVRPTRLEAARAAARAFLEKAPERFRVGVVSFASRAEVALPATEDRDAVRASLANLTLGEGTAMGDGIGKALDVIRGAPARAGAGAVPPPADAPPAAVLLLSDGTQTEGRLTPQEASQRARAAGVPVFTVAVGTPDGIVERTLPGGFTQQIRVPPDPETLQQVARATRGEFFSAPDAEQLSRVYEDLGSRLGSRKERREITDLFAAGAAGLLLVGGAFSAFWFRRLP